MLMLFAPGAPREAYFEGIADLANVSVPRSAPRSSSATTATSSDSVDEDDGRSTSSCLIADLRRFR